MEEKEYLLTKSIRPKHDEFHDDKNSDQTTTSNQPSFSIDFQTTTSNQPSFSINTQTTTTNQPSFSIKNQTATTLSNSQFSNVVYLSDEEEESGVFCVSSVFQKSDPTTSLSYWMGKLLTEKMLEGRSILLKQLLSEAEFEENQPRSFTPDRSSTPKIERSRSRSSTLKSERRHTSIVKTEINISSTEKTERNHSSMKKFEKRLSSSEKGLQSTEKFDNRKRKLESVDSCTESLLEVSRRLDGLLSNSRKMNEELKKVRKDLDGVEVDMARVSANFKTTKSQFREMNDDPLSQNVGLIQESQFVTNIIAAAFGSEASRQKVPKTNKDLQTRSSKTSPPQIQTSEIDFFKNFFESSFWGRRKQHSRASSGEEFVETSFEKELKKEREQQFEKERVKEFEKESNKEKLFEEEFEFCDEDFSTDDDPVDLMSCVNIPNLTSFSNGTSRRRNVEAFEEEIQLSQLRRRKVSSMKMIFDENHRLDPKTTFTSLMDFDFFSQIRQPWRKCQDVDINFIV